MIEWSEADLAIRDAVRAWIEREIKPHLDQLETGQLPPYDSIRKLFADFGIDAMASDALTKMLTAERNRVEGSKVEGKKVEGDLGGLNGVESMAAIVVSELAAVSLGTVASAYA